MAKRSKTAQEAYDIAKPEAEKMGFDLVDAEYKKEGQGMFLRLFIDRKGGISIDDCEAFSKVIDPILDEKLKCDADFFEVSSPGLTRPLDDISDYIRYEGEKIDISLFKADETGSKKFTGTIVSALDDTVVFKKEDDTEVKLALSDISKAIRHIDF
ncbi:MAG: ribosome maturation factor RimP [Clostridiales bacterium]|nr:ribosome maturation factor RimP [Clostridiales bacterium]